MAEQSPAAVAAFIDLAPLASVGAASRVDLLARPDRLGAIVSRAVVHGAPSGTPLPHGWADAGNAPVEQAAAWAFEAAADLDLPLLVIAAGAAPSAESVASLAGVLDLDPLFGFALPRLTDEDDRLQLPELFGSSGESAPLRVLASLPDLQVLSERVTPGMLIRPELIGNLRLSPSLGGGLWPALADYAIRARRIGFRPVMCNRVVVPLLGQDGQPWGCPEADMRRVQKVYAEPGRPPVGRARRAERLLAAALDRPRSLVLDARNLTPTYNGTSVAILGACDALHRVERSDAVSLWLHPDAAAFYRASERFKAWTVCTSTPSRAHAAALRLSQPWNAAEIDTIRDLAAVNVFWMLDNIAWDIGYAAPADLDATWQRLAAEADCLLFISDFSRQRFANRFTCEPAVRLEAALLSLDPADYALPFADSGPAPPYWLVVGNRYDHKHVPATVDLLARSFPTQNLVVFGDRDQPRARHVTRFPSGRVDEAVVRACYARADVVVFPSFYEGFGLPILEGLSYGRTVVVRDSPLVRELASAYQGPGRLIPFTSERVLLDVLSGLRRGTPPEGVAFGGTTPWGWDAVANRMLELIRSLVAEAPSPQMLRRTGLSRGLSSAGAWSAAPASR